MKTCVSIDMDNHQEYQSLIDPAGEMTGRSFYTDALPRFLDILDASGVRATFFMVGRDALVPEHRRIAREIVERGHEVGNHSHTHPYSFASLSREGKLHEITTAEQAIADATGQRPVGFRTPSSDVDIETLELLAELGYVYDASTFASPMMLAFLVYGKLFVKHDEYRLGSMRAVVAPSEPFRPSGTRLHRRREPGEPPGPDLIEMPLSVTPLLRLPFYATFLRMLGPRFFRRCVRRYGEQRSVLQMAFHLMDLVDLGETSLSGAVDRTPGLGVSFERRAGFVSSAIETLSRVGENATMGEVAAEHASRSVAAG